MKSHLNVVSFTFSLLFTHFVFPLLLCLSLSVFRLHIYSLFFFLDQSGGQLHNRYSSRNIENIKQYYHSQCCMHVCVSARHVCINSVCTSSCPMRINASCVWLYAPACLRARELQLYVHVAYTCMCVCVCVCLRSLHCEQQASWHLSEDGLAYQTTGTTLHVSWQLPPSHGVDYTRDMGISPGTKWKRMRVEQRGTPSCLGSHRGLL